MRLEKALLGALLTLMLMIGSEAAAQITDWGPPKELAEPRDSSVTITIANDRHYGFNKGWVSRGRAPEGGPELVYTEIYFLRDGYWGRLGVSENLGRGAFLENSATKDVKRFGYWRDRIVDPSDTGTFTFEGATLRWIAFPHRTPQGKDAQCGSLVSGGKGSRISLRAYWCTEGGRPTNETDVRGLVNAVGYKDFFSPRSMAAPPGR